MKKKDNNILLDYMKLLKQAKYIFKEHAGKDILGNYADNLEEFNNTTGVEDKEKIKSEDFNE